MKTITKIITLPVLLFLCSVSSAFEVNDPIAHWKFDEGSGTIAYDSAGDNDGTLVNGPVWTTGQINGALSFDGTDDYITVGSPASLDDLPLSNMTVCAWICDENTSGYPWRTVAGCYAYNHGWSFRTVSYSGSERSLNFEVPHSGGKYDKWAKYGSSDGTIIPNTWHHVAAVWDGSTKTAKLYIDGNEPSYQTTNPGVGAYNSDASRDKEIGRIPHVGGGQYFNGKIDDIRIYDRALSAEEVQMLYQQEPNQPPEPNEPILTGLEITGPNEVAENSQTQYSAIAYYDDSSTKDVTDSAVWFVEPNTAAAIDDKGLLTTETIFKPQDITIYAQYTEGDNTVGNEKAIAILAICPKGNALRFDGVNDYINLGNSSSLKPPLPVTISAWIKLNTTGIRHEILHIDDQSTRYYGIWFAVTKNNTLSIGYGNGGYPGPSSRRGKDGETALTANQWYHVAAILRGPTSLDLYINAVADTGTYAGSANSLVYSTGASVIGTGINSEIYFNGVMDDVRVYNRALSAQEIKTNMHIPLAGNEPNLVAYWNFDEGQGQVAHDTSAGGNNGYLGSDPCNPDGSDPVWVDSNAPVGICSIQELIDRNISDAIEIKLNVLDEIEQALEREKASAEMLLELSKGHNKKHCWWKPREILKRITSIRLAIIYEIWSANSVDKSIDKLKQAQYPPPPRK